MRSIEKALSVPNQQNLWRFVVNGELFSDVRRNIAMTEQVEIVRFELVGSERPVILEAVFGHSADAAGSAVFENETGLCFRPYCHIIHLLSGTDGYPGNITHYFV